MTWFALFLLFSDWFLIFVGLAFVTTGFYLAIVDGTVTCSFDKNKDKMVFRRERWLLGNYIEEHSLQEIETTELEKCPRHRSRNTYRVIIRLRNGKKIPFSYTYEGFDKKDKEILKEKILDFLRG